MLVSKEILKTLRKTTKSTFKGQRGDISWLGNNDLQIMSICFPKAKEGLSMHLQQPLQTKVPIDDLYREPAMIPNDYL